MKKRTIACIFTTFMIAVMFLTLGCDEESNGESDPEISAYSIGGTVRGLMGSGLVLQNNGSDDLAINENGGFSFPEQLENGDSYQVTVKDQPVLPAQYCTVQKGDGTISGNDVTDVLVTCYPDPCVGGMEPVEISEGDIVYDHSLHQEYSVGDANYFEDITVTGSVHFVNDENDNITGSGVLGVHVDGGFNTTCEEGSFSGDSTINVSLTGKVEGCRVIIDFAEIWYVGNLSVYGTVVDHCDDDDTHPYHYIIIQWPSTYQELFGAFNGYRVEKDAAGESITGYYSWTLNIY